MYLSYKKKDDEKDKIVDEIGVQFLLGNKWRKDNKKANM